MVQKNKKGITFDYQAFQHFFHMNWLLNSKEEDFGPPFCCNMLPIIIISVGSSPVPAMESLSLRL